MRIPLRVIALMLLLTIIISCAPQDRTEYRIGVIASLTGVAGAFGQEMQNGIELAAEEINAKGGINGLPVKIIVEDDNTDPVKGVSAFSKLVNVDQVDALIGGTWDFNYNPLAPLAKENQITLITPQNVKTSGLITNEYTFVMRTDMKKVVGALEEYITENNLSRISIVRFVSPFGEDITQGLKDILSRTGGELVLDETYEQIGGNDFMASISKVRQAKPDAVFIDMVGADVNTFMKRLKENGVSTQVLSHGAIADVYANPELDRSLIEGIVFFDYDKPESEEFISRYQKKVGTPPGHSADGAYDALMVLAQALDNTEKGQVYQYLAQNKIQTLNGEVSFKNQVRETSRVFIREVTDEGIKTLSKEYVSVN